MQHLKSLVRHLSNINARAGEEISKTYLNINSLIEELEAIQNTVVQKHQAEFTADYKEHMLKV
jgi:flagellar hook-associated protein FlgK